MYEPSWIQPKSILSIPKNPVSFCYCRRASERTRERNGEIMLAGVEWVNWRRTTQPRKHIYLLMMFDDLRVIVFERSDLRSSPLLQISKKYQKSVNEILKILLFTVKDRFTQFWFHPTPDKTSRAIYPLPYLPNTFKINFESVNVC